MTKFQNSRTTPVGISRAEHRHRQKHRPGGIRNKRRPNLAAFGCDHNYYAMSTAEALRGLHKRASLPAMSDVARGNFTTARILGRSSEHIRQRCGEHFYPYA